MTNREKLRQWQSDNNVTAEGVAQLLTERTGDKITKGTIEKYRMKPEVKSSLPCPGWVIDVLTH